MKTRWSVVLLVVISLFVVACDSGTVELSTTSSVVSGTTEPAPGTGTTTLDTEDVQTTTTLRGETIGSYEVLVRLFGDNGETFHILIPEGAYTDVDLENFIGDLIEDAPELWGAEVFDSEDALQAFVIPEDQRTEEQQALIDEHHFVSLVNGDTVRYQGPFLEFGEFVIGS